MAREPFPWLSFKSKAQREKERKEYAAWAFPYGAVQQEKVRELLKELLPKEDTALAMMVFLQGKEVYLNKHGEWPEERNPLLDAAEEIRRGGIRIRKGDLPLYLALIVADARVDACLKYPSAEELRSAAAVIAEE